ncbi:MAG: GntR family transcriptional regulator [Lentisphaerae bacterium]|nr:GntR family transcriptional regulator [Lentisphaerota bacterium]
MQRKSLEVLKALEDRIRNGNIGASGFLPAERDLCQTFGIGRGALQSVFAELTARKLIRKVPGKGMRIIFDKSGKKSRKFMLLIPQGALEVAEQFEILKGVVTAADKISAEVVLFFCNADIVDKRLASRLQDGSLEGVILMEKFTPALHAGLEQAAVPYVIANYENDPGELPVVQVDFRAVGRSAGRLLVKNGFRRIGFVGGKRSAFLYRELFAGLKGALAEDDLAPENALVLELDHKMPDEECCRMITNMLKKHARNGLVAFFAGRDRYAKMIYKCCESLNLRIPEDVSVVGYDNISWENGEKNGLTTIAQPVAQIGQEAFNAICSAVELKGQGGQKMLGGELILRRSVASAGKE